MAYAVETRVPVDQTQREIRKTLERYGATAFMFGEQNNVAVCAFEMKGRRIRFTLELPIYGKMKTRTKNWTASKEQVAQRTRSLWRALLLAIKAKLECAESGISTFEQEFLAHIVMPNGQTVGAAIVPQLESSYQSGSMPPLLGPAVSP